MPTTADDPDAINPEELRSYALELAMGAGDDDAAEKIAAMTGEELRALMDDEPDE